MVKQNNQNIAIINDGFFAGEMSFITETNANADVIVNSNELNYLSWQRKDIDKLKIKNRELYEKLNQTLAINVILKVNQHVKFEQVNMR